MFTAINTLWTAQAPRHAEQTDAHQYIQKQDPQQKRRKKKRNQDSANEQSEEGISISVTALRGFLERLLHIQATANRSFSLPNNYAGATQSVELKRRDPMTPLSARAAAAAASYQNASQAAERRHENILMETTDTASNDMNLDIDLSATDMRTIYIMIDDLKYLSAHNIENLHITNAVSFVQSIKNAIQASKQLL